MQCAIIWLRDSSLPLFRVLVSPPDSPAVFPESQSVVIRSHRGAIPTSCQKAPMKLRIYYFANCIYFGVTGTGTRLPVPQFNRITHLHLRTQQYNLTLLPSVTERLHSRRWNTLLRGTLTVVVDGVDAINHSPPLWWCFTPILRVVQIAAAHTYSSDVLKYEYNELRVVSGFVHSCWSPCFISLDHCSLLLFRGNKLKPFIQRGQ